MKRRKRDIVFLDIDGVLTLPDRIIGGKLKYGKKVMFRRSAVELIHLLQHFTRCHFVITSSWRIDLTKGELESAFLERGLSIRILDITPVLNVERGQEIDLWLQTNLWDKYIVVDDSTKDIEKWCENVIKVNPLTGFNETNFQHSLGLIG
jgi:hypothetical protein